MVSSQRHAQDYCARLCAAVFTIIASGVLMTSCEFHSYPCVYHGHLQTEDDWFGFLANITILKSGRISFEFSVPKDSCCAKILFYNEDQMNALTSHDNCWQKEGILRMDDNQLLHLTPSFPWSGCHMVYSNSVATYICKGGRSFRTLHPNQDNVPSRFFIAASNCAQHTPGLDLIYRIELVGHVGECIGGYGYGTTTPETVIGTPQVRQLSPSDRDKLEQDNTDCVVDGTLETTANWHGFIANVTFKATGGFRFRISFPYKRQYQYMLLYNEHDISKFPEKLGCWDRYTMLSTKAVDEQVIRLHERSSKNGCIVENRTVDGQPRRFIVCEGKRRFNSKHKIYFAFCNCASKTGQRLQYRFELFNFVDYECSSAQTPRVTSFLSNTVLIGLSVMFICRYMHR